MLEINMLACSINSFYRTFQGRMLISKSGRVFKADIAKYLDINKKICGPIKLTLIFHFKDKRRRDVDNYAKVLIDCLKNVLFEDDDKIYVLHMEKEIGMPENKIFIDIEPIGIKTINIEPNDNK